MQQHAKDSDSIPDDSFLSHPSPVPQQQVQAAPLQSMHADKHDALPDDAFLSRVAGLSDSFELLPLPSEYLPALPFMGSDTQTGFEVPNTCAEPVFDAPDLPSVPFVVPAEDTLVTAMRQLRVSMTKNRSKRLHPRFKVELAEFVSKNLLSVANVSVPLSRPCFNPEVPSLFLVATQPKCVNTDVNLLEFSMEDRHVKRVCSIRMPQHVQDIQWLSRYTVAVAFAGRVGILQFDEHFSNGKLLGEANLHQNVIRQIKYHSETSQLLSGGHDGAVVITNIREAVAALTSTTNIANRTPQLSANPETSFLDGHMSCVPVASDERGGSRYVQTNCRFTLSQVVGSVSWHPSVPSLACCTADVGWFYGLDVRQHHLGPVMTLNTCPELYTHGFVDQYTLVLGFGDASMRFYDTRKLDVHLSTVQDPRLSAIGDIQFSSTRSHYAVFGCPELTAWTYGREGTWTLDGGSVEYQNCLKTAEDITQCTAGEFLPHSTSFGATTSHGTFAVFDLQ